MRWVEKMNTDDYSVNCHKDLGEFVFSAEGCPPITPSSDTCCKYTEKDITVSPCQSIEQDCIDVYPDCEGRLLVLHVNLKNICPNRIIIVGVLIYENGRLYAIKAKKVRTGSSFHQSLENFDAGEFCFLFQEEHPYKQHTFKTKVISHYVNF